MARGAGRGARVAAGVVLLVGTGFAASACLLTGLLLDGDPGSALHRATRAAWVLAALSLALVGALTSSRVLGPLAHRGARGGRRARPLLLAAATTALWTVVALAAGWDPAR